MCFLPGTGLTSQVLAEGLESASLPYGVVKSALSELTVRQAEGRIHIIPDLKELRICPVVPKFAHASESSVKFVLKKMRLIEHHLD